MTAASSVLNGETGYSQATTENLQEETQQTWNKKLPPPPYDLEPREGSGTPSSACTFEVFTASSLDKHLALSCFKSTSKIKKAEKNALEAAIWEAYWQRKVSGAIISQRILLQLILLLIFILIIRVNACYFTYKNTSTHTVSSINEHCRSKLKSQTTYLRLFGVVFQFASCCFIFMTAELPRKDKDEKIKQK
jgi:hypothetical protein